MPDNLTKTLEVARFGGRLGQPRNHAPGLKFPAPSFLGHSLLRGTPASLCSKANHLVH